MLISILLDLCMLLLYRHYKEVKGSSSSTSGPLTTPATMEVTAWISTATTSLATVELRDHPGDVAVAVPVGPDFHLAGWMAAVFFAFFCCLILGVVAWRVKRRAQEDRQRSGPVVHYSLANDSARLVPVQVARAGHVPTLDLPCDRNPDVARRRPLDVEDPDVITVVEVHHSQC